VIVQPCRLSQIGWLSARLEQRAERADLPAAAAQQRRLLGGEREQQIVEHHSAALAFACPALSADCRGEDVLPGIDPGPVALRCNGAGLVRAGRGDAGALEQLGALGKVAERRKEIAHLDHPALVIHRRGSSANQQTSEVNVRLELEDIDPTGAMDTPEFDAGRAPQHPRQAALRNRDEPLDGRADLLRRDVLLAQHPQCNIIVGVLLKLSGEPEQDMLGRSRVRSHVSLVG
jgi:hypothetical protein